MLQHDDWLSFLLAPNHFNNAKLLSAIFPTVASYALAQRGLISISRRRKEKIQRRRAHRLIESTDLSSPALYHDDPQLATGTRPRCHRQPCQQ